MSSFTRGKQGRSGLALLFSAGIFPEGNPHSSFLQVPKEPFRGLLWVELQALGAILTTR